MLITILLNTIFLSGCKKIEGPLFPSYSDDETYFETEFFKGYMPKLDSIMLCGLTELGMEQEILIIPSEIDGIRVDSIGFPFYRPREFLEAKAKKIFLPGSIKVNRGDSLFDANKVILLSYMPESKQHKSSLGWHRYVPPSAYDSYINMWGEAVIKANVSFLNNYDDTLNGGYWWIDHIDKGEKIFTVPPEPKRDGYIFKGWYTELECLNKWNFEEDIKGDDEIILYALWT